MKKFVITKRKNGEFQFNLIAGNNQVILVSEGYTTRANCEKGIESVKRNSQDSSKFNRMIASNGKPYFNLKATNGQIIGTSQMYESETSRDNGMESVRTNALKAITVDEIPLK
ncbi:MAG: YegP family protein [Flavobacterium sp.]|uniref:YegP family protein n=1 Tax=Flavobacterium sp. TaxID=239 RepID=UPI00262510FF|nr:YegP family protein [Flavobacterium sp.]MDD5150855.1 YegP family protein [Flavobacterium sp.]